MVGYLFRTGENGCIRSKQNKSNLKDNEKKSIGRVNIYDEGWNLFYELLRPGYKTFVYCLDLKISISQCLIAVSRSDELDRILILINNSCSSKSNLGLTSCENHIVSHINNFGNLYEPRYSPTSGSFHAAILPHIRFLHQKSLSRYTRSLVTN